MKNGQQRSFDPIIDDYAFFEVHSTEGEMGLRAYAAHLGAVEGANERIRMLDFGSGTGSFSQSFLQQAGWPPVNLELTLVEPGEVARKKAAERLSPFSAYSIEHAAGLPEGKQGEFSLILANHSLYYVPDLAQTAAHLYRMLRPGGKLLAAMAGKENVLIQCWAVGFELLGQSIPYYTGDGLRAVLEHAGMAYQEEKVFYSITFPDATANRMKILRFLFGPRLPSIPLAPLLAFFDPYAKAGAVHIETEHLLYAVG